MMKREQSFRCCLMALNPRDRELVDRLKALGEKQRRGQQSCD
jgi:hypothetical protein